MESPDPSEWLIWWEQQNQVAGMFSNPQNPSVGKKNYIILLLFIKK